MKYWLKRIEGWSRLRFGFCPLCNSSPPDVDCRVCFGTWRYGHLCSEIQKTGWKKRYKLVLKGKL